MVTDAAQLLRQLEPTVRPFAAPSSAKPQTPIELQSFDQLLALAAKGRMPSGRQIQLSFDPTPPLEASQLERLATAADQAEAAGAKRALLLIDGRGFVLDVANRTITAEMTSDPSSRIHNIDAAIFVARDHDNDQQHNHRGVTGPADGPIPASVLKQLMAASLTPAT